MENDTEDKFFIWNLKVNDYVKFSLYDGTPVIGKIVATYFMPLYYNTRGYSGRWMEFDIIFNKKLYERVQGYNVLEKIKKEK